MVTASVSPAAAAAVTVSLTLPWCGTSLLTIGSRLYSSFIDYFAAVLGVPPSTVIVTSAICPTSTTSSSPLQIGIPMIVSILFKNVSSITSTANALLYDVSSPETVSASLLTSLSSWYTPSTDASDANIGQVARVTSLLVGVAMGQAIGCYVNTTTNSTTTSLATFTATLNSVAIQNGITESPPAFSCNNNTVTSTYTVISNLNANGSVNPPNQLPSLSVDGIVIGTLLFVVFASILIYFIKKARNKNANDVSTVSALNSKLILDAAPLSSSVEDGIKKIESPLSSPSLLKQDSDFTTFSSTNLIPAINHGSLSPHSPVVPVVPVVVVGNVAVVAAPLTQTTTPSPTSLPYNFWNENPLAQQKLKEKKSQPLPSQARSDILRDINRQFSFDNPIESSSSIRRMSSLPNHFNSNSDIWASSAPSLRHTATTITATNSTTLNVSLHAVQQNQQRNQQDIGQSGVGVGSGW